MRPNLSRKMTSLSYFTVCFALCFGLQLTAEDFLWSPTPENFKSFKKSVEDGFGRFAGKDLSKGFGSRETSTYLLNAVVAGLDPEKIEKLIDWMAKFQETDPQKKSYGNFYWYWGDTEVKDYNGVQFNGRTLALVWKFYRNKLNATCSAKLEKILRLAAEAAKRQGVNVSYSNIYLMKIFNLIAFGESLDLPALAEEGYRMLDQWVAYTWENGVSEFLSPTYTAVDLENLSLVRNLAGRTEGRALAESALLYLWNDVFVNWYAPSVRLGGAHSRDYDRLTGHGDLDRWVAAALSSGKRDASPVDFYSYWNPPASVAKWLDGPFPRLVHERWNNGRGPTQTTEHYMGKKFDIATASANYWDMDKTALVVNLGSGPTTPQIVFFMDGRGDWYGNKKIMEGSGHMKSLHLRPFTATAQRGAEAVFLVSTTTTSEARNAAFQKDGNLALIESTFTLPNEAEYWLGDKKLAIGGQKANAWMESPGSSAPKTFTEILQEKGKTIFRLVDTSENDGLGILRRVPVKAGRTYREAAFIKGGVISLYLTWFDAHGSQIGDECIKEVTGGEDYVWKEQVMEAPPTAAECQVWIYSRRANVTDVRLADLKFEELDAAKKSVALLAGFEFAPAPPVTHIEVPLGSTLFVKRADAALAIRPLSAKNHEGKAVCFDLVNDGATYGAMRLTATHDQTMSGKPVGSIVYATAAEGLESESAFASWRKKVSSVKAELTEGSNISVKIHSQSELLGFSVSIAEQKVLEKWGVPSELQGHLLSVNGKDIGREILRATRPVEAVLAGYPEGRIPKPVVSLLANAAFQNVKADKLPENWTAKFDANGKTTFMETTAFDGKTAVKISDKDAKVGVGFFQIVPVTPGNRYRLGASLQGGSVSLYINWLDADKKDLKPEHQKLVNGGAGKWEKVEATERADSAARYAMVWFYSTTAATSEVYVADPVFEDLGP